MGSKARPGYAVDPQVLIARFHPAPGADSWRWSAACAQKSVDPWLFFLCDEQLPKEVVADSIAAAKQVCSQCVVRQHCLADALVHDEHFGIWGGLTFPERKALAAGGLDRLGPVQLCDDVSSA